MRKVASNLWSVAYLETRGNRSIHEKSYRYLAQKQFARSMRYGAGKILRNACKSRRIWNMVEERYAAGIVMLSLVYKFRCTPKLPTV